MPTYVFQFLKFNKSKWKMKKLLYFERCSQRFTKIKQFLELFFEMATHETTFHFDFTDANDENRIDHKLLTIRYVTFSQSTNASLQNFVSRFEICHTQYHLLERWLDKFVWSNQTNKIYPTTVNWTNKLRKD